MVLMVVANLGSNPDFASAKLNSNVNDNGDADRILQGNSSSTGQGNVVSAGSPPFVQGEILVKFKTGASEADRNQAMAAADASVQSQILTAAMQNSGDEEGVTLLETSLNVPEAVQAMIDSGTVKWAEPNYIYKTQVTSNDPYLTDGTLWGMCSPTAIGGGPANEYGIGATTAWENDKTDCSSVYIGIIDEGYNWVHQDLAANAGTNPGEIPEDGIDNDGNGYVDDVHGWDFQNGDNTVYDGTGDEHGTHVAGTIGGVGGNGAGVAGVCWKVKLLNAKFIEHNWGGTGENAIKAIDYFTDLKTRKANPLNIVATNNSWGGYFFSQGIFDAIERARNAGILFVAAAGNDNLDNDFEVVPFYPASHDLDNVIAVASITSTGELSDFSNYGPTSVDIGAPGSDIWSTLPENGYGYLSGTSMATPHVTGAVALYKARNPTATATQIKEAILAKGTATDSLNGMVLSGKRLNVAEFPEQTTPKPTPEPTTPKPTPKPTLEAKSAKKTAAPTKAKAVKKNGEGIF